MTDNFPIRKRPAEGVFRIDGQPTVVFDTIRTKDKKSWLASPEIHEMLVNIWREASTWLVGRYVILPDHIHYFAWTTDSKIPFKNWVKYWKSQLSNSHQEPTWRFQSSDWDRRMRSETQYEEKWSYVLENPVRAGLVQDPFNWAFKGVVHDLRW